MSKHFLRIFADHDAIYHRKLTIRRNCRIFGNFDIDPLHTYFSAAAKGRPVPANVPLSDHL